MSPLSSFCFALSADKLNIPTKAGISSINSGKNIDQIKDNALFYAYFADSIAYRPVDKRENFIKRCIGLPGEEIIIEDQNVYINGEKINSPVESQTTYRIEN